MIVVFGGTGTIGGAVLRRLSEQDAPVRAAVRSPERAAALSVPDVRTVVADLADPTSLPAALQDVERVFVATPVSEDQVALESALVDAVAAAPKRPHLVKLAALGYDAPAEDRIALTESHARIVGHARELDVPLTVLAANGFMSNLLGSAATVRGDGVIYGSSGDGGVSWIDPDDVGAVAAHVLLSGGHEGASYDVTGPEGSTRTPWPSASRPCSTGPCATSTCRPTPTGRTSHPSACPRGWPTRSASYSSSTAPTAASW